MKQPFKSGLLLLLSVMLLCCRTEDKTQGINEVMQADIAFSELSSREGRNRSFLEFAANEAVLLRPESKPIEGKAAIEELLSKPDTSYTLTWKPLSGRVAKSKDMGYTYGTWELTIKSSGEKSYGTYATVWTRDSKGRWKWVLDTGNEGLESKNQKGS